MLNAPKWSSFIAEFSAVESITDSRYDRKLLTRIQGTGNSIVNSSRPKEILEEEESTKNVDR